MGRERDEVLTLLGETIKRATLVTKPEVDDGVLPLRELDTHIVEVAELAPVEE